MTHLSHLWLSDSHVNEERTKTTFIIDFLHPPPRFSRACVWLFVSSIPANLNYFAFFTYKRANFMQNWCDVCVIAPLLLFLYQPAKWKLINMEERYLVVLCISKYLVCERREEVNASWNNKVFNNDEWYRFQIWCVFDLCASVRLGRIHLKTNAEWLIEHQILIYEEKSFVEDRKLYRRVSIAHFSDELTWFWLKNSA